jgi:AraC-like DNA-binding protein
MLGFALWRFGGRLADRLATSALAISIVAWTLSESPGLRAAFGGLYPLAWMAAPAAGFFWLFVLVVFEDRKVDLISLLPAASLFCIGVALSVLPEGWPHDVAWTAGAVWSGALVAHAMFVIVRGWRGDLMEGRRQLRAPLLGAIAAAAVLEVLLGLTSEGGSGGPLEAFAVGSRWGGALFGALFLVAAALFLKTDPTLFGSARTDEAVADPRLETADRIRLDRLSSAMAAGAWKRESLTIAALARELDIPVHRLRRLINQRLGHRNFIDFLNGYRIEEAKRRLADPNGAATTIAVIAFDLGYGSLGPFNRAFRSAAGCAPTEWRRNALREALGSSAGAD